MNDRQLPRDQLCPLNDAFVGGPGDQYGGLLEKDEV
jgi:hypothetical protein